MAELTNEQRLDLFAEMIEPATEIFTDPELREIINSGKAPLKAVKPAIKNHKQAVITLLAILEETDPAEYRVPAPGETFWKLLSLFSRPEIKELFMSQGQMSAAASSGSATANTEGGGN